MSQRCQWGTNMLSLAAAPKLSDNSRRGLRTNGSGARQVRRPEPMSCELDPLFGRDTANDMIWPDRQKDRAAFDPSLLSRLCVRSADAVKTTGLVRVGTLRPVRTAAADVARRTSIRESNVRNSQCSLRDRSRPRCYGLLILQRWTSAPTTSQMLRPLPLLPVPFRTLPNWNSA
jgi:hypothetical protein